MAKKNSGLYLSIEDLASKNAFDEVKNLISIELQDIDRLYKQSLNHYNKIKNSPRYYSGSLTFLSNQSSSLVSMKTAKITLLRLLNDLNTKEFGNLVKMYELQHKDGSDKTNDKDIMRQLLTMLGDKHEAKKISRLVNDNEVIVDDEAELDRRAARKKKTKSTVKQKEIKSNTIADEPQTFIVATKDGSLYKIDDDNVVKTKLKAKAISKTIKGTARLLHRGKRLQVLAEEDLSWPED